MALINFCEFIDLSVNFNAFVNIFGLLLIHVHFFVRCTTNCQWAAFRPSDDY